MRIHFSLKCFVRSALCIVLAAALCCSCAAVPDASGSSAAQSSLIYNTAKLDDGKLRLLSSYNSTLGSAVLSGSEVLCQGSPSDTLELITDNLSNEANYYLHAWSDASSPTGRRSALYDRLGAEVLSFDAEVSASLWGVYLVICEDPTFTGEYDLAQPGSVRLFDLSTQEDGSIRGELPVPANTVGCAVAADYFAFTIYDQPADAPASIYEDGQRFSHCRVQVQDANGSIVYERAGFTALNLYGHDRSTRASWVELRDYTASDGYDSSSSLLYRPADGKLLENFEQLSGNAAASFLVNGKHQLRDLSGGATGILGEFDAPIEDYAPGVAVIWNIDAQRYELHDLSSGEVTALRSIGYASDVLAVYTVDGVLRTYDRSAGEVQMEVSVSFDAPAENGYSIDSVAGGYLWLQKRGGSDSESEIRIYAPNGSLAADLTPLTKQYTYLGDLTYTDENGLLLVGGYSGPGGTSLYDVIDCKGNVLVHGLGLCYATRSDLLPQGCFIARRGYYYGWMDMEGNWLYCQNVFSTLSADDGNFVF